MSANSDVGTAKQPNPHEPSLGKFLRGREHHVTTGYLRNEKTGQIRKDTLAHALDRQREEAAKAALPVNLALQEAR